MYNDYKCPKCYGNIRVDDNIILSAKSKHQPGAIVLLHPELGNYTISAHKSFKYKEGQLIEFYCPICHHSLNSNKHLNLALMIMTDENGQDFDIYFSKVTGEKSTMKMIGEHVEVFGQHSEEYLDFFNLSQNF